MSGDGNRSPALARPGNEWERHRRALWALGYRLTGVAADADDVVQETFVRAAKESPDGARPLGPWLTRVALNVARDLLRARKRRGYDGPWLPSPVSDGEAAWPAQGADEGLEGRYGVLESASFAFLLALEQLTPMQRAVLILRDVVDYSVRETAEAVGSSEAAVKAAHLRARKAMASYDEGRRVRPSAEVQARHMATLHRFLAALGAGDAEAVEALLAGDVVSYSDGGGEFKAARRPVRGAANTTAFLLGVARKRPPPQGLDVALYNGLPSAVLHTGRNGERWAPTVFMQCLVDTEGMIRAVYLVMTTRKLGRVVQLAG